MSFSDDAVTISGTTPNKQVALIGLISKVWSYVEAHNNCGTSPHNNCPAFVMRARSNVGLGWVLSMGRIVPPENPLSTDPNGGYQTRDGAVHAFYHLLNPETPVDNTDVQPGVFSCDNTYSARFRTARGAASSPRRLDSHIRQEWRARRDLRPVRQLSDDSRIETASELSALTVCALSSPYRLSSAWELNGSEGRHRYVCFTDKIFGKPAYPKNIYTKDT